jgi:hypothetical protein
MASVMLYSTANERGCDRRSARLTGSDLGVAGRGAGGSRRVAGHYPLVSSAAWKRALSRPAAMPRPRPSASWRPRGERSPAPTSACHRPPALHTAKAMLEDKILMPEMGPARDEPSASATVDELGRNGGSRGPATGSPASTQSTRARGAPATTVTSGGVRPCRSGRGLRRRAGRKRGRLRSPRSRWPAGRRGCSGGRRCGECP